MNIGLVKAEFNYSQDSQQISWGSVYLKLYEMNVKYNKLNFLNQIHNKILYKTLHFSMTYNL